MLLIRHGETVANLEQRYHGRLDSPLTERGIAQAQAIGRRLSTLIMASSLEIVSSPQPRAHKTAEILRECFDETVSPVRLDERLSEVSIGEWEGLSQPEIIGLAPGTFDGDGRYNWCFRAPGGETCDAFAARISDWLAETTDHPALVVVTHGIVARVLRGLYAAMPRPLALSLPIPQDRVYRLEDKGIDEITVDVELSMPRITRISALPGHRLYVEFDDGLAGTIDIRCRIVLPDEILFQQFTINDFGAVCWPSGEGLGPDVIYRWVRAAGADAIEASSGLLEARSRQKAVRRPPARQRGDPAKPSGNRRMRHG
jgi:broad specificity phosphatase PhoE